jgi:hypothetical protein
MIRRSFYGFASSTGIGALGDLIGLAGAEFRLPLLKGGFKLGTLDAIVFNKAMSLIVVTTALILRGVYQGWEPLLNHSDTIFNLLAGSLIGA